jgi:hypothetical protein
MYRTLTLTVFPAAPASVSMGKITVNTFLTLLTNAQYLHAFNYQAIDTWLDTNAARQKDDHEPNAILTAARSDTI